MKMKRAVLLVVVAVFGLPCYLSAQTEQTNSIQQAILGTWKLVSYVREEIPSGAKSDVMGAHPSGYINYGGDGRMIVIIVGSDRKKPEGAVATPREAKTVTHHIDVSWDQSRTGTDHVRSYKLEGHRFTLTTEPSTDPATGKKTVRTLIWERLK